MSLVFDALVEGLGSGFNPGFGAKAAASAGDIGLGDGVAGSATEGAGVLVATLAVALVGAFTAGLGSSFGLVFNLTGIACVGAGLVLDGITLIGTAALADLGIGFDKVWAGLTDFAATTATTTFSIGFEICFGAVFAAGSTTAFTATFAIAFAAVLTGAFSAVCDGGFVGDFVGGLTDVLTTAAFAATFEVGFVAGLAVNLVAA